MSVRLGLVTLALLVVGTLTVRGGWRAAGITEIMALSSSYFLLWVFLTTETLKRFPTGRPFAVGPDDPSLIPVRVALLVVFVIGVSYQLLMFRSINRVDRRIKELSPAA